MPVSCLKWKGVEEGHASRSRWYAVAGTFSLNIDGPEDWERAERVLLHASERAGFSPTSSVLEIVEALLACFGYVR